MMRNMLTDLLRAALRGLRNAVTALLALLILFEEWGWEPLQRLLARIARWPWLRQVEAAIVRLPPRVALALFLLPTLALLPVKLLALGLIARGEHWLGLAVIIVAKLAGTAIVARLFTLTQPALLRMPWFASIYRRWTTWKEGLLQRVRASWAWRSGRAFKRLVRLRWARWQRG